jgi:hypothetical protein
MSNQTKMRDVCGKTPVAQSKNWKKPVLDILELERAESIPNTHGGDHLNRHSSQ